MTKKKETKKKRLSKKRKGFAKDFVKTGNATEAAVRNFNVKDRDVARRVGSELLTFPDVIAEVEKIEKSIADQIPNDLLVTTHIQGLGATQVRFTPEGEQIEVPDFSTRHKYVESGYKLKKVIGAGDETPKTSSSGNTYNFIFSAETQAEVKAIEEKIKARLVEQTHNVGQV